MKKAALFIFFVLFIGSIKSYAQNAGSEDRYYVKTVRITKVAGHQAGFLVRYLKDDGMPADTFLPYSWFQPARNSEEHAATLPSRVQYGRGLDYPRLSVFYTNGRVSSVSLYLMQNYNDLTWETFNTNAAYTDEFNRMKDNPSFEF
jgi:hypothetical protein